MCIYVVIECFLIISSSVSYSNSIMLDLVHSVCVFLLPFLIRYHIINPLITNIK